MKSIEPPLQQGDSGEKVGNLQEALLLLIDKGIFVLPPPNPTVVQPNIPRLLTAEHASGKLYKDGTALAVSLFRDQFKGKFHLTPGNDVDEATAKAINTLLGEQGVLASNSFIVNGQVRYADGLALQDIRVVAVHEAEVGSLFLGESKTDSNGQYSITYEPLENIALHVSAFDERNNLLRESDVVRSVKPQTIIDLIVTGVHKEAYRVEGKIISHHSLSTANLRVVIFDKGIGGDVQLAETMTDEDGAYQVTFFDSSIRQRGKIQPDIQVHVLAQHDLLGKSEVRYNASNHEKLNVLLEERAAASLQSEYDVLTNALGNQFVNKPGDLIENDEQQDITYLANKTGWDARAVAMAALADQFSDRTKDSSGNPAIPQPYFYALFRAGLPANEHALYQVHVEAAENVWKQAIAQGVIPAALESELPQIRQQFQTLSAQWILDSPASIGASSLKEMLSVSFRDETDQAAKKKKMDQFAELYTEHRANPDNLWKAVKNQFGAQIEQRMRLDGKLAYLTFNNAELISQLHDKAGTNGVKQTLDLVDQGFYRAEKWLTLIKNATIPPEVAGESDAEKQKNYAELMAAQIRLSFPTAVIAEEIKQIQTPVADYRLAGNFLREQHGNFEIGVQPVEQYVAHNNLQVDDKVLQSLKQVQRVYQITPSDSAMTGLLKKGIDSAYAVTHYDQEDFVRIFKDDIGSEEEAKQIHAKAQQVHNAVLNIATSYLIAKNASPIGVHSPAKFIDSAPSPENTGDVIAYPTIERLFGEMDYCACEHCRSILSPAAYLVNLLQFIDKKRYNNAKVELPPDYEGKNPLDVLLDRRPDIAQLQLTCENTNTPVPYIDLVNEILEYFIFNKLSLDQYKGHDTDGSVTPAELLARPQFSDNEVSISTYKILSEQHFPLSLPFHQALENLRRYFYRFETSLPEVMEVLRKDESIERASEDEYGWQDILMEELGCSRAEYTLLSKQHSLQQLYGYGNATSEKEVLTSLSNAKYFTRRLGISYEDLAEILKTGFINPHTNLIPKLERLGLPFETIKKFKDGAISDTELEQWLPPKLDTAPYDGDIKTWLRNDQNYSAIMSLITLTNPNRKPDEIDDNCSFDKLEFRYSDPDQINKVVRPLEFHKLIRFIRLWKKLGWSIDQTDKAITALYPQDQLTDRAGDTENLKRLDAGFLILLPRLGIIRRVMKILDLNLKNDLLSLLTCFAPIDTRGTPSLYRQMFLNPVNLQQDPIFSDVEALRAAFRLTGDEFNQITSELGYNVGAGLALEEISQIFRRGWLARKLKLSIREFLLLMRSTDIDPYLAPDLPDPPILRFIATINRLRTTSFNPGHALYLIWNEDFSGKSAPNTQDILNLGHTLRTGFSAIESEYKALDDPDGQIARTKMALVYGSDVTDRFFGLLEEKTVTDVPFDQKPPLADAVISAGQNKLTYDHLRKRLVYTGGIMPDAIPDAVKKIPSVDQALKDAVDKLHAKTRALFGDFPEWRPLFEQYVSSNNPLETRRNDLLAAVLSMLKPKRKFQQLLQVIGTAAGGNIALTNALINNKINGKYILHANNDASKPVWGDFAALEQNELPAKFDFPDTATGTGDDSNNIWSGYLESPTTGYYNFYIETDGKAVLALDGKEIELSKDSNVYSNKQPIELRAGAFYAIDLKVEKVILTVRWESEGRPKEIIPAKYLYAAALVKQLSVSYTRFLKVASLTELLGLSANEIVYFASHDQFQIAGQNWLNSLPVTGSASKVVATSLLQSLNLLLDFSRIKNQLSPNDERLLTVLKNPKASILSPAEPARTDAESLLLSLTRWESDSLNNLLIHYGKEKSGKADWGALTDLQIFDRILTVNSVMKKMGISAAELIKATTNEPKSDHVRDLQAALRARFEASDWLNVLKPINDEMRVIQRDALIAYILHQMRSDPKSAHIDTADKLFEYFLIDVQMAPCMQISRIRLALSSIQLFIERCLMNLENKEGKGVFPASINVKQWEWMKRYRVWEANRKVFLYPENWLEPELRDDQSPFFKEMMSELLQSDIAEDSAAVALLNYLTKLNEVAKLEPCGIHFVENDPTKLEDDVMHMVARTAGANRKYYYRRREYGYWTPWEQIRLDIEDNPVVPVVWKGRLFLFWLRILKQPVFEQPDASGEIMTIEGRKRKKSDKLSDIGLSTLMSSNTGKIDIQAMLCWCEFYNGQWQATQTSDINKPVALGRYDLIGDNSFDRSKLRLQIEALDQIGVLSIYVDNTKDEYPGFYLFNTHSLPIRSRDASKYEFQKYHHAKKLKRRMKRQKDGLVLEYGNTAHYRHDIVSSLNEHTVLMKTFSNVNLVQPTHVWSMQKTPFFYEDSKYVFYVTTELRPITVDEPEYYTANESVVTSPIIPAITLTKTLGLFASTTPQPDITASSIAPIPEFSGKNASYITKNINSLHTFQYGNKEISIAGKFQASEKN